MLEEGALGRGRRGSRTSAPGGGSTNQSPHPASRRKKRRTDRRRSRTVRRRQRAKSGLPLLDSRNSLGLGSVVLHRDNALVLELHEGRNLRWPVGAADFTRVRDDDYSMLSAFPKLHVAFRETLLVPLAERLHDLVSPAAVPLTTLSRVPHHVRVEDSLHRPEVALAPSCQALPRDLGRVSAHVTSIRRISMIAGRLSRVTFAHAGAAAWLRPRDRSWDDCPVVPYAEVRNVKLYYERAGSGEPELLFVPGWCCDHTAFQPQFDHFARAHCVTSLDLRGCGQSDAPEDGYSIPQLAEDVVALCAAAGIERPVVVGHSLGGMIAVELAARYPSFASALVLVDPGPIDALPETVEFFRGFAEQLAGRDGDEIRREYVHDMGARDEERARWIVDHMCAVPLSVAAAVIRGVSVWNGREPFTRCLVPVLLIRSNLGDDTDALRLRKIKPDLEVGITVGAGHFHQLEVPEQVNAMIERFLQQSA